MSTRNDQQLLISLLGLSAVGFAVFVAACVWIAVALGTMAGNLVFQLSPEATAEYEKYLAEIEKKLAPLLVSCEFCAALEVGNVEEAYGHTTQDFQTRQSLADFADFPANHPEVNTRVVEWEEKVGTEDLCVYVFTTESSDGTRSTFEIHLRKEADAWKVNDILVPEMQGETHRSSLVE